MMSRTALLGFVWLVVPWSGFAQGPMNAPIRIEGGGCRLEIDPARGTLIAAGPVGKAESVLRGGEHGLWRLTFDDHSVLDASQFRVDGGNRRLTLRRNVAANRLELSFDAPEAVVVVEVRGAAEGVDLSATVRPGGKKSVLSIELPARLRFDPKRLVRLTSPLEPHEGVGAAFQKAFFQEQPSQSPTSWRTENLGPAAHDRLVGAKLAMRPLDAPAEPLAVTHDGQRWLGASLSKRLAGARVDVCRPSARDHLDRVLLDSPVGPVLAANRLGGQGALWRWGGFIRPADVPLAAEALAAVVRTLAADPVARHKVGLVHLVHGPEYASASAIPVNSWAARLKPGLRPAGKELVELTTPAAMLAAARGDEFAAILNPYGEALPVGAGGMPEMMEAVGQYIRRGGNWIETGGYSFYLALRPERFLQHQAGYPPLFADWVHVETSAGMLAVYRVQPRDWVPWKGESDPRAIFIPGKAAFGGDAQGGWIDRSFATHVPPQKEWKTPRVRLSASRSVARSLDDYAHANGLQKRLRDKLPPALLDRFRRAVLVKYDGNARDMIANLSTLPVPTLIHFSDYLKGGFDKQYPDHLPPRESFGTPAELRDLFDRAHALGHLMMPYTNPTWWCDHPRGPTFVAAGDGPLARSLEGKPYHEQYGRNDGWTTTPWHPAVQAANRSTRTQFTRDYPVDILFQDQCGARGWVYDRNPASPMPHAYTEGLLSQVDEDAQFKPLSTEDGFDRVLNGEVQLCGFTFALVPGGNPTWARPMKSRYPEGTWEISPVAQILAHDKVALLHHDLGKFVTDRPTLSWTLGLGFAMSDRLHARALADPRRLNWLRWLDRVQKSICARYVGEPVGSFVHEPGHGDDDGLIRARYGPVDITANLGPKIREVGGLRLSPHGFHAEAPGMRAGDLEFAPGVVSPFIVEGGARSAELWLLAPAGIDAAALVPKGMTGRVEVILDGQNVQSVDILDETVRIKLPAAPDQSIPQLWHARIQPRSTSPGTK
ncbi:MAG: hypothetical protein ACP5XB_24900 [Isosphaeraceae bacterium]